MPEILKFIEASGWDSKKTLKSIQEYNLWRKTSLPPKLTTGVEKFLKSGIIYLHGKDCNFRPILVFNIYLVDPKWISIDDCKLGITYYMESNNLFIFIGIKGNKR